MERRLTSALVGLLLASPAMADIGVELLTPFADDGRIELQLRLPVGELEEQALLIDGELWMEGKILGSRVVLDATLLEDGHHEIAVLAAGEQAIVEVEVLNPDARITSFEAPRFAVPGETLELRVQADAVYVDADFSALDPGFDPVGLDVEQLGEDWIIHYAVPPGEEGFFPVPIRAHDLAGRALVLDDLQIFRLSGPLQPFESEDALMSPFDLDEAEGDGAAYLVEAPEEIRLATDETVYLPFVIGGELDGATLELGIDGFGGHLTFPVDAVAHDGELAFFELPISIPQGVEVDLDDRWVRVRLRDARGRIGSETIIDPYYTPRSSGRLTVTLGWGTAHDLDLEITEPGGAILDRVHSPSASGGTFPIDANAACANRKGREYGVWQTPPNGQYEVRVKSWGTCGATGSSDESVHVSGCGLDQTLIQPPAFGGQPMTFNVACTTASVSGRARYQRRSVTGAVATVDLEGVPLRIRDASNQLVASGRVGRGGRYEIYFNRPTAAQQPLRLELHTDTTDVDVFQVGTSTIHTVDAFSWNPLSDLRYQQDFTVPVADSGALHILRMVGAGHRWYAAQGMKLTPTLVEWTGGAGGLAGDASYFRSTTDRLYLLGKVADPDQFDDSVILHELAHRASHHFSSTKTQGGPHKAWQRSAPSLAWNEGVATYLGQAGLGHTRYVDRLAKGVLDYRIDTLTGVELGPVPDNDTGNIAERVVMSFLWDLRDGLDTANSDRISGAHAALMSSWRALRTAANITKRGDTARVDFADFVDHYTCSQSSSGRKNVDDLLDNRYSIDWVGTFCKP